jgi:uncharacterized membrane protein YdjX (TVP38/TMEM64 family)/Fe-S oxidoreductase
MAHGTPLVLSQTTQPAVAFQCSLCGLCESVCPENLNPSLMFLEMRREVYSAANRPIPEHRSLLNYEKRGTSRRFTWYGLPDGCDTVFFPGCSLTGTRPDTTLKAFRELRKKTPGLGIVLDCCTKPSHDFGRHSEFTAMFGEMTEYLAESGIRTVITACPNCHSVFRKYGTSFDLKSIYQALDPVGPFPEISDQTVTVHDSCVMRHETDVQHAVRHLIEHQGIGIREMEHHGETTYCCGEGGAVSFHAPHYAEQWTKLRIDEAKGQRIISYCAGCTGYLSRSGSCSHILDLYFDPEKTLAGKANVARAPMTTLNRLSMKRRFRKEVSASTERERPFVPGGVHSAPVSIKRWLFLVLFILAISAFHKAVPLSALNPDTLSHWISAWGVVAPLVYIFIYTLAPVFLLPALPLTLLGGILFGPFWGVLYCITGATSGACLSFLISRYVASDLINRRLTHPMWTRLNDGVEKRGWKMVALTRLIPLFPFNLLNYAFGLTRIPFLTYAVTTFITMFPACVAFIVFSSSITDLVKGNVSKSFFVGLVLIASVIFLPVLFRRIGTIRENAAE